MKSFSLFLLFTFVVSSVQAFCIYNNTPDIAFFIRQMTMNTSGNYTSRFKVESLRPSDKACCPFTTKDCNKAGGKDDIVTIAFHGNFRGIDDDHMYTSTIPAGGWLELRAGSGEGSTEVHCFYSDGSPFNPEIQVDVKAMLLT